MTAPASRAPPGSSAAGIVGLLRSLLVYHRPGRQRRLRRFYRDFVHPGVLCFDVGAHVGNRVRAFAALGARVVAVEPHPGFAAMLERWYAGPQVTVVQAAVSRTPGRAVLHVSSRTPTLCTLSREWMDEVRADRRFQGVRWDRQVEVPAVTLDELVARHGEPAFCKIDVEGHEPDALAGLSRALPCLSFEYLPACLPRAHACVARLEALAHYEYNWSPSETLALAGERWCGAGDVRRMLDALPAGAPSGDLYARRVD